MPKITLFNDEGEDDGEGFRINKDYATGYERWRRNEELAKYKALGMDVDESSSSDSDEGDGKTLAKPDNPEFDREFLLSLGTLYKIGKGENVDVGDVQFFKGDYRLEKEKEEKPLTLKDFERQVIVDREGQYDEEDIDTTKKEYRVKDSEKVKIEDGLDDSEDDGDGLLNSGLFKVKEDETNKKDKSTENEPGNEAVDFVKGVSTSVTDPKQKDILETVKNTWTNKKLPKKERWLVDFFLNKRYLDEGTGEGLNFDDSILDEEELSDEQEADEDNPLSTQYKYRHQEPGELIKRHPRSISSTVRLKDEKRKEKREATKQRTLAKKEEKRKEIEVLKALKLKEIEEKIDKIKEASGNEDIDLGDMDLESDFDSDNHDKYMEQMFGDDYYDPSHVEQEIPDFEDVADDTKMFDNWTRDSATQEEGQDDAEDDGNYAEYGDYGDFNVDEEYNQYNDEGEVDKPKKTTRRKGRRHQSKFSRAVEKKKPVFDPREKDFASYFEEYYKLDFEDVVGGIPCRFKYRKVEPNNFGLTTEEILAAQNSELNKWVGIKKMLKYDRSREDELKDRNFYQNRALYEHVKRKYMPSLFAESSEELAEQEREKRRLKNLKRKQKKWMLKQGITDIPENNAETEENVTNENGKRLLEAGDQELPGKTSKGDNDNENTLNGDDLQVAKKKRKKDKNTINEETTPAIENVSTEHAEDTGSSPKKKKKKKKNKQDDDVQSTPHETELAETAGISNNQGKSKKKKKINQITEAPPEMPSHKKKHNVQTGSNSSSTCKNRKSLDKKSKKVGDKFGKKKYHAKNDKAAVYFKGISDARLEAYGQNPKKLKNRVKYGEDV